MTEFVKIVAGIIQSELGLEADQVVLANEKFFIPTDERLYCSVMLMGARSFGAKSEYAPDPVTGDLVETTTTNQQEAYSVVLYSRGGAARQRQWEVSPALASIKSQQEQEKYGFQIGYLPTSMNQVPDLDGTALLNKYALTVRALVAYQKTKPVDYYDRFAQPVIITNP